MGTRRGPSEPGGERRRRGRRLECLLTTVHPERALSNALAQHLAEEMPDIDFTLDPGRPDPDVVWKLRLRHANAFLVVTGRGPIEHWADGVREAGADYACGWPVPVGELVRILHRTRRVEPRV